MKKIDSFRVITTILFVGLNLALNSQSKVTPEIKSILKDRVDATLFNNAEYDFLVTDDYTSRNVRHIYLCQAHEGIEITESYFNLHFKSQSNIYKTNQLLGDVSKYKINSDINISAAEAIRKVAVKKGYDNGQPYTVKEVFEQENKKQIISLGNIASEPVTIKLVYFPLKKDELDLCWEYSIYEQSTSLLMYYLVHAGTGAILRENIKTITCTFDHGGSAQTKTIDLPKYDNGESMVAANSYNVFQYPVESPNFGGRSIVTSPWLNNTAASPIGWHNDDTATYTSTKGNNVDAYEDSNNTNSPSGGDAARAVGGVTLDFNFAWSYPGTPPATYQDAAITNLFYWGNLMHDVWYNYGFDEPSGNFQAHNFTNSGLGNDFVKMEAQDGSGTCNANWNGDADGTETRVQMYLCNGRDGDMDNLVIAHEYAHGISTRLTGGPSNGNCLNNQEQMGEGWSDYMGAVMTIEPGDLSTDLRPVGTWLFGQGPTGNGIRPFPYTTNMNQNPMTYATIAQSNITVPHGVGSVWATMLWDMTWDLIAEEGWDPDIYNGSGGNNTAMTLVTEAMKLQPCSPGFIDGRNAILLADTIFFEGSHSCLIWSAFARRGLGYSASQGSSSSRSDGVEAFDKLPYCTLGIQISADVDEIVPSDDITYTLETSNNDIIAFNNIIVSAPIPDSMTFVSATNGGYLSNDSVFWPSFNLIPNDSKVFEMVASLSPTIIPELPDFFDNMEGDSSKWLKNASGSTLWRVSTNYSSSPTHSWFANDGNTPGIANLIVNVPLGATDSSLMVFKHRYQTELHWDGGVVEISLDNGLTWADLGSHMIAGGYNDFINFSRPAFSGNSNGFVTTTVDLSAYIGYSFMIRFQMSCDVNTGGFGWNIDDVSIINNTRYISQSAQAKSGNYVTRGHLKPPTKIVESNIAINLNKINVTCFGLNNGSASVSPTGGTGVYNATWSNGATGLVVNNLSAGNYSVTVTSGTSSKIAAFSISQPSAIGNNFVINDADNGNNGSILSFPNGGSPGYTYLWSNGGNTNTISGIAAGTYSLTITDNNACTKIVTADVIDPYTCGDNLVKLLIQMDQNPEQISYHILNFNNAVVASGGPFTYVPDGYLYKQYFCLPDDCYELKLFDSAGNGLCNGNSSPSGYYVLEDAITEETISTGCNFGSQVNIDFCKPNDIFLTVGYTDVSCNGTDNGAAIAILHNALVPVGYRWSNFESTQTVENLAPGSYTVTVTHGSQFFVKTFNISGTPQNIVNNTEEGPGSIRDVVAAACPSSTITFDTSLNNQVVKVLNGEVLLDKNLEIVGNGNSNSVVSANLNSRIFNINSGLIVAIRDLTLKNSMATVNGGAVLNFGNLTLSNTNLINNFEGSNPKPLSNLGSLLIEGLVQME